METPSGFEMGPDWKPINKLTIAIPSYGQMADETVQGLFSLFGVLLTQHLANEITLDVISSCNLPGNREQLVERAIERGATKLLFIDGDITFAPKAFLWLASRQKPSVAANYPKRKFPIAPTAWKPTGEAIITTPESTGLEECAYSGFGLSLFDMNIIKELKPPRFMFLYNTKMKEHTTEDYPFYKKIWELGVKHYIDHDASKCVGHMGPHPFSFLDKIEGDTIERG